MLSRSTSKCVTLVTPLYKLTDFISWMTNVFKYKGGKTRSNNLLKENVNINNLYIFILRAAFIGISQFV